ncbi:MAG: DNA polymerase I [Firmicutes bacterium]|uniref:DNA polymerase I n=1 Tax=Candidatus Scatoplasma merdavium TaxID=2840932 RepID=A0A9D9GSZ8_9BACL|nr:DNA polymerase I [Candidatus Scatoplasma merdavium]
MSKIYIIDGNSLLFRSFYASFRPGEAVMQTKDGIPTNAVVTYQKMMETLKGELSADDKMVVCFDTDKPSFRAQKLDSYKMNRKPLEPALKAQLPIARELLDNMGIYRIEVEGYEADDLAGSLSQYAAKQGDQVCLFSSDKDFLQLLTSENITLHFLKKGLKEVEIYSINNVKEKKGYRADQVVDFKGLAGDASDNIPGVKGIGEKSAIKYLDLYGHLEGIFEGLKNDKSKAAQNILEHKQDALFCREIATIDTSLDVKEYYLQSTLKDEKKDELAKFYLRYEMNRAYKELMSKKEVKREERKTDFKFSLVSSFEDLGFIPLSLLPDNSEENFHEGELKGFYFSDGNEVSYISVSNLNKSEGFKNFLKNSYEKYTYDYKGLLVCLHKMGVEEVSNVSFDLLISTYILNQNVQPNKRSCLAYYHYPVNEDTDAFLAYAIPNLVSSVRKQLEEDGEYELYSKLELPLSEVLARMEIEGFPLNLIDLKKIDDEYQARLASLTEEIIAYIGHPINLNSPKQLASVIYDELKLKKKGKVNSTSIDVLKKLVDVHPVISKIIEYRKYQKLVSSYTSALGRYVKSDNKIHAIFNQALTNTGRLSMSEPNLQNISIRNEDGKEIRKSFYYSEDELEFLSLDYSQIELRVLASLANLNEMIEVFNKDIDIHSATASKIFNVDLDEVTPEMRRKAKAVNFGIVYGISPWGLSEQIDVAPMEASEIIESFYDSYPGLRDFESEIIAFAKVNGYVRTVLNRRRYINEINETNKKIAEFGERAAVNTVIQGSAADLIKVAMIKIDELLKSYKSKMVLQIHDELIFKIYKDEKDELYPKLKELMEHALDLKCQLKVEGSFGKTWYDCK